MVKEGSSDYKKVRKRWFFKEPLTEWFFAEPKMVLLWHRFEEPLFLRVYAAIFTFQELKIKNNNCSNEGKHIAEA